MNVSYAYSAFKKYKLWPNLFCFSIRICANFAENSLLFWFASNETYLLLKASFVSFSLDSDWKTTRNKILPADPIFVVLLITLRRQ